MGEPQLCGTTTHVRETADRLIYGTTPAILSRNSGETCQAATELSDRADIFSQLFPDNKLYSENKVALVESLWQLLQICALEY